MLSGIPRQHENAAVDHFGQNRLRKILQMTIPHLKCGTSKILDIGCGDGSLSRILAKYSQTIAVDVKKRFVKQHENDSNKKADFVLADVNALPFKSAAFDLVVCASMLEHMLDLDDCLSKLKDMLRKNGILIAAYPVETRLFKLVWRFISPREFKFIDQTQTFFVNPYTKNTENYWKHYSTHKQNYISIRQALSRHFKLITRVKLPFVFFPDLATYYECSEMISID